MSKKTWLPLLMVALIGLTSGILLPFLVIKRPVVNDDGGSLMYEIFQKIVTGNDMDDIIPLLGEREKK